MATNDHEIVAVEEGSHADEDVIGYSYEHYHHFESNFLVDFVALPGHS